MGWVLRAGSALNRFLARFVRAKTASIAIIFALSLIPLLVAAGAAVDLSRALVVRTRLSQALDAAGLAVGATINLTQPQMQDLASKYFNANYPADKIGVPGTISVNLTDHVISMTATATLPTALMYIVGIDHLDVGVANKITRETKGLEVALVLDNTGSMGSSGKIQALITAGNDLIDTLSGGNNFPDHLKIGIVPFTVSVKLDTTQAVGGGWIDTTGASSVAQANFSGGKYAYWLYTNAGGLSGTPWAGCVEARPNRLDETDTPPGGGDTDTLFVPWFSPDEPDVKETEIPRTTDVVNTNQTGLNSNYSTNYLILPNETVGGVVTQNSTNISTSNTTFTFPVAHGLATGYGPLTVSSSGTLPNPLVAGTNYWVINSSSTKIKLATSLANATAGTAVAITNTGTNGAIMSFSGVEQSTDVIWILEYSKTSGAPTIGKDVGTGTTTTGHALNTGDGPFNVYIASAAGTMPTGLSAATQYWAIKVDANRIKLATGRANALAGTAVNLTANGSGTFAISEAPTGTDLAHQTSRKNNWEKYVGRSAGISGTAFSNTYGPNAGCDMQQITPLTNDMQALKGKINSMVAAGSTNVPMGLTWGWKLVSPTAPYTDGVAYSDNSTIKAIILMTDGDNDMPGENSSLNQGGYNSYGFPAQARMGTFNGGGTIDNETEASGTRASNPGNYEVELGLNESEARLCTNIKAIKDSQGKDRIRIYTIALMVSDSATISLLQNCASDPDTMFFNTPSASELQHVFQTIAQDLSNLRVSQ